MSIFGFFFGEITVKGEPRDAARILNLCMELDIPFRKSRRAEDGFFLTLSPIDGERLLHASGDRGLGLTVIKKSGLPYLCYRYRHRLGLFVGFLLVAVAVLYSSQLVWGVRITGNERLHEDAARELLSSYGLVEGRYIPSLSFDEMEMKILLENPDIAWISIHRSGTTVNVELRETDRGTLDESGASANLVASTDGVIERIEVFDGRTLVKVGDTVRAGEALVSGLYDNSKKGLRMTRATGAVYARTVHDICIEVPFVYEEKVYTGEQKQEKSVKFFGKEIKVFTNTRNDMGTCDIIYYEKMLSLVGGREIPVGIRTVRYLAYVTKEARHSESEAMDEAFFRLQTELAALSERAELLGKEITFEITDEAYILRCRVVCIEDIAVRQKIEIGS